MPDPAIAAHTPIVQSLQQALNSVLLGKPHAVRSALTCLLAGGHLLIEDLPGMGKTLLAHGLAKVLGLSYSRVQFTGDLLPADITGGAVFERDQSSFRFVPGPIFTEVLLADEIDRAAPRTQSALLEAMAEGQVTVDGETHALPDPFFVIATQNPHTHAGTFPLPESQLDRFLMRIELGFPDPEAERQLLRQGDQPRLLLQPQSIVPASLATCDQHRLRLDDRGALDAALAGCDGLVIATGARPSVDLTGPMRVDAWGVRQQVESCQRLGIRRVVLVSSLCAGRWRHPLNLFGLILVWKRVGEQSLERSGLDWTVIRPGGLSEREEGLETEGIRWSGPDTQESDAIPRRLVARCCLEALN
ncbi:MAG: AAA family ATPase, partial [Gammaproteobacteria bacterium]